MKKMKKKARYQTPWVRFDVDFETESALLVSSKIDVTIKVDPLEEHYFEGTESTSDYLIEF